MKGSRVVVALLAVILLSALLCGWTWDDASAARQRTPALWKNCTNVTKKYPHGVGRASARDKTSGEPVMTFRRSNRLYATAMSYNKGLDRDNDGIACETK